MTEAERREDAAFPRMAGKMVQIYPMGAVQPESHWVGRLSWVGKSAFGVAFGVGDPDRVSIVSKIGIRMDPF